MWLASWFSGETATIYSMWGKQSKMDTTPSQELLGIKYRSVKESALDMVEALISTGYVPD